MAFTDKRKRFISTVRQNFLVKNLKVILNQYDFSVDTQIYIYIQQLSILMYSGQDVLKLNFFCFIPSITSISRFIYQISKHVTKRMPYFLKLCYFQQKGENKFPDHLNNVILEVNKFFENRNLKNIIDIIGNLRSL